MDTDRTASAGAWPERRAGASLDEAKAAFRAAGDRQRPRFNRQCAVCGEQSLTCFHWARLSAMILVDRMADWLRCAYSARLR